MQLRYCDRAELLPFFALSPIDKEELEQAFLIDQIGTERFQTHMEIKRILEMSAETVIGENSVVAGNSFVTTSIPANTKVASMQPELEIKEQK